MSSIKGSAPPGVTRQTIPQSTGRRFDMPGAAGAAAPPDPAEGREPGIHEHPPLEYGFRVRRRAPPRNDEFLCKALWEMLPLLFLWQIPMIRGLGFWFPNPLIWIGSPGRTRTSDQAVNRR